MDYETAVNASYPAWMEMSHDHEDINMHDSATCAKCCARREYEHRQSAGASWPWQKRTVSPEQMNEMFGAEVLSVARVPTPAGKPDHHMAQPGAFHWEISLMPGEPST